MFIGRSLDESRDSTSLVNEFEPIVVPATVHPVPESPASSLKFGECFGVYWVLFTLLSSLRH